MKINKYLLWYKAKAIREAKKDFKKPVDAFTRKKFFYFFLDDGYKWIHIKALEGVYTNAFTYSNEEDTPNFCYIKDKPKKDKFKEICQFIERGGQLFPKVMKSNNFYYYKVEDGSPLTEIDEDIYFKLKHQYEIMTYTPFYNSMCYNLIQNSQGEIKMIDYKHFEERDANMPFFIYMNNDKIKVNDLYLESGYSKDMIKKIIIHLRKDYEVSEDNIKWMS